MLYNLVFLHVVDIMVVATDECVLKVLFTEDVIVGEKEESVGVVEVVTGSVGISVMML